MRTSEPSRKGRYATDISPNEYINGVFVVAQAQQFQAKNGPFWRLTLQDASGQIEGKLWSPMAQEFSEFATGALYAVEGKGSLYKDKVELSLSSITYLPDEALVGIDLADFVAVSPYPVDQMVAELRELFNQHVNHPPLERFFESLLSDEGFYAKFIQAPAAKAMHHAYAGGLLEHTLSICRLCMSIASNYPHIDRQILLVGALCHDLGKIWELTSGLAIDYTDEGRLVGHISLGLERITPYMERAGLEREHILHIQHLILSHHGAYEFGAPRLPATAEAFILHFADNIDAKLQQVAQALDGDSNEPRWSNYVRGLERQVYQAPQVAGVPFVEGGDLHDSSLPPDEAATAVFLESEPAGLDDPADSSHDAAYMEALLKDSGEAYLVANLPAESEFMGSEPFAQDSGARWPADESEGGDLADNTSLQGAPVGNTSSEKAPPDCESLTGLSPNNELPDSALSDSALSNSELEAGTSLDTLSLENTSFEDPSDVISSFQGSLKENATEDSPKALPEISRKDALEEIPEQDASKSTSDSGLAIVEETVPKPFGVDLGASAESVAQADAQLYTSDTSGTSSNTNKPLLTGSSVSLPEESEQAIKQESGETKQSKKRAKREKSEGEAGLEDKVNLKNKPSTPKQPSLPLLEQCSLLSKE